MRVWLGVVGVCNSFLVPCRMGVFHAMVCEPVAMAGNLEMGPFNDA